MIGSEYVSRIIDRCPVEVYLSANDGARTAWPYRMQPTHEANPRYAAVAETFIVDSAFQRPDLGNRDALEKAVETSADVVVLEDVWQDFEATVQNVLKGLEMVDDHAFDGEVLVPLQAPHGECYEALAGQGVDRWAIGGVKDLPASEKLDAARTVRKVAGEGAHIHGLGWGATDGVVRGLREEPGLVDAIDSRSAHAAAMRHETWPGEERSTVTAVHAAAHLLEASRRLTPGMSGDPVDGQQATLITDGGVDRPEHAVSRRVWKLDKAIEWAAYREFALVHGCWENPE